MFWGRWGRSAFHVLGIIGVMKFCLIAEDYLFAVNLIKQSVNFFHDEIIQSFIGGGVGEVVQSPFLVPWILCRYGGKERKANSRICTKSATRRHSKRLVDIQGICLHVYG